LLNSVLFLCVMWIQHVALLGETMSTPVLVATADQTLEEVECHFEAVSGLPVVDSSLRCVGVVVKNDRARASHGVSSLFPSFSHANNTHAHTPSC
jgi:CBS domain-containing protein